MSNLQATSEQTPRRAQPAVDVYESDSEYQVHVELPGVQQSDVQLTLETDGLRLRALRKAFTATPILYDRSFSMPNVIDPDKVKAQLNSGVLVLTLPKRAAYQRRQIEIQAA
jgi:HSP20 family protein